MPPHIEVWSTLCILPSLRHLSASEQLSYLHWLPVHYRIQFKIAALTYKTLATCQPSYLYKLLQVHQPSRALRFSTQKLLQLLYLSTDFGQNVFSYSSPATWNKIPTSINKKLRYREEHSASVVLSWCTYNDISREKICWWLINPFYVIGHESYRIRQNNAK